MTHDTPAPPPSPQPRLLAHLCTLAAAVLGALAVAVLLFSEQAFELAGLAPDDLAHPLTARETLGEALVIAAGTLAVACGLFVALLGSIRLFRDPTLLLGALLVGLVVHALSVARVGYLPDAAYVNCVYARHFPERGLVFNVGEHAQGYSSLLLVFLLAPFAWFSETFSLPDVAKGLSLVASVPTVSLLYVLGRRLHPDRNPAWSLAAPLLLTLSPCYLLSASTGLETSLATLLVVLGAYLYLVHRTGVGSLGWPVALGVAALARWDAAVFVLATWVCDVAVRRRERWAFARLLLCLALAAGILGGAYAATTGQYGHTLPSALLAEGVTDLSVERLGRGAYYAGAFLARIAGVTLFLVPLAVAVGGLTRPLGYGCLMVVAGLAYACVVGGGALPGYPLLVPIAPLLFFLLQESAACLHARLASGSRRGARLTNLVLLFALVFAFTVPFARDEVRLFAQLERLRAADATSLRYLGFSLLPEEPETSIAVRDAGQVKFLSGKTVIGLSGRSDPKIASLGADAAPYVLGRRPTYIALPATQPVPTEGADAVLGAIERRLFVAEAFQGSYTFARALARFEPTATAPGKYLWLYERRPD